MKNKNIFFCFIIIVFLVFSIFISTSCEVVKDNINENENQSAEGDSQKSSTGVISLMDSLGVGDVSLYPGYVYDKELNAQLGKL